jgi:dipeptidase E
MAKLIIFSQPESSVLEAVKAQLFPKDNDNKNMAYMPSDGAVNKRKYTEFWTTLAKEKGYTLTYIDNSLEGDEAVSEIAKLMRCSVLLVTGGNTFTLLRNLKRSGMDNAVKEFIAREGSIYGGFSAGAIVITPRIDIVKVSDNYDENTVGLKDLSGLDVIPYEIFPHYQDIYAGDVECYRKENPDIEVKTLRDDEYIVEEI